MTAYIVFTRGSTKDQAELATYSQAAGGTLAGRPVTPRTFYGRQVLEGAAVEGVAILEFPTFDEAKDRYDSPAYRAAREHQGRRLSRRHRRRRVGGKRRRMPKLDRTIAVITGGNSRIGLAGVRSIDHG
jgi:uncharacterized protein (DUF1330 family)